VTVGARKSGVATSPTPPKMRLSLAPDFDLSIGGRRIMLPRSLERVLAYLALNDRPVERSKLAGVLWLDSSGPRAASNLRTTLWRLGRAGARIVQVLEDRVALSAEVAVDVTDLSDAALRLIESPDDPSLDRLRDLVESTELLPDWDEDWIATDRERYRMLRLQALDRGAEALIERGETARALEAALAAVATDPLRESARRLLVRIHLAQGNLGEAFRAYEAYRKLLSEELGLDPSPEMEALVHHSPAH
jgi:DNA-binding SARP family transcriptional activator